MAEKDAEKRGTNECLDIHRVDHILRSIGSKITGKKVSSSHVAWCHAGGTRMCMVALRLQYTRSILLHAGTFIVTCRCEKPGSLERNGTVTRVNMACLMPTWQWEIRKQEDGAEVVGFILSALRGEFPPTVLEVSVAVVGSDTDKMFISVLTLATSTPRS